MSDNFIPLNQSTPVQGKMRWQPGRNRHQKFQRPMRSGYNNQWPNSPRSSFGSNSSNNSFGQDSRNNIDEYLHPSMLEDPWENFRKRNQFKNNS